MSVVKANDFLPITDFEDKKPKGQIDFEANVALHKLPLDLNYEQREKLKRALDAALSSSARNYFVEDPDKQSWIGLDGKRVTPINEDIKPFFDAAVDGFEQHLSQNWNRLGEERKTSLLVKAKTAVYSGYKTFFSEGSSVGPTIFCFGEVVCASDLSGLNLNGMIQHINWAFAGMLLFGIEEK